MQKSSRSGVLIRLNGKRFGNLFVLRRAGRRGSHAAWLCRCDCGVERIISGMHLRYGHIKSCNENGHRWKRETKYNGLTTKFPSEYQSWRDMRRRCEDPKSAKYKAYGARGIKVCDRWKSFEYFVEDMGRKPQPRFTIERKNVNQHYEPGNCCWISKADQGRNRQNSVYVTYEGKKKLLIDLVEELGLSRSVVFARLKLGWTLAQAIGVPKQK